MQLPNYTQVSNEFIEKMNEYEGYVVKVFLAINRKTVGWHKISDRISQSQLVKMTGIARNTVKKSIDILVEDNWIIQTETKFGYIYDLNIKEGVSHGDPGVSHGDPGGSRGDLARGSRGDHTKETPKETITKDNNTVAVDFQSTKHGKIIFTWPEVQKLCNETGKSKDFIVEYLELAVKKADTIKIEKTFKGWVIKATRENWPLDEKEQPGEAEREYQQSKERNEREARTTKANIEEIRKAAIESPEAQPFRDLLNKLTNKQSIDEMIQAEDLERKAELNKQRVEVLKKELLPA